MMWLFLPFVSLINALKLCGSARIALRRLAQHFKHPALAALRDYCGARDNDRSKLHRSQSNARCDMHINSTWQLGLCSKPVEHNRTNNVLLWSCVAIAQESCSSSASSYNPIAWLL